MLPMRKIIAEMAGYVPGFQPDESGWIKLNTNENPYPPSPKVAEAILAEVADDGANLRKYPMPAAGSAACGCGALRVDPSWVIMANGSDELLNNLIRAFAGGRGGDRLYPPVLFLLPDPGQYPGRAGAHLRLTDDLQIADFPASYEGKLFFLTSPNAPLGFRFSNSYIADIATRCSGVLVVDEAYVDFADHSAMDLVKEHENVVVTRTFSKSYALAGMRLGLAVARPEVIQALDKIRDHYHLDRLALVAATAALKDQDYLQMTVNRVRETRDWFCAELRKIGYRIEPSHTNFVFAEPPDRCGQRVYDELYARKILVRYFSDPLLKHGMRISMGTREEMETTLAAMVEIG